MLMLLVELSTPRFCVCMQQTSKALVNLCKCAGLSESWLHGDVISTRISYAGSSDPFGEQLFAKNLIFRTALNS